MTTAACEDGRSIVTGTRRSRSHGEAMLSVTSASTQTCQLDAIAARGGLVAEQREVQRSAPRTARSRVQPPKRWVSSNTLWTRLRTTGSAHDDDDQREQRERS